MKALGTAVTVLGVALLLAVLIAVIPMIAFLCVEVITGAELAYRPGSILAFWMLWLLYVVLTRGLPS
jgi:hypothetical protein